MARARQDPASLGLSGRPGVRATSSAVRAGLAGEADSGIVRTIGAAGDAIHFIVDEGGLGGEVAVDLPAAGGHFVDEVPLGLIGGLGSFFEIGNHFVVV